MFKRSKAQEKKGSEKREVLLVSFLKVARFVFAIILVLNILRQIKDAVCQLENWNDGIVSPDDYAASPDGMKTLAATSMLLEAIGEGIKKIDSRTKGALLKLRPEIPWDDVK